MMPNKVKPSRSWVANYEPTSLEANELAINWVDAKAYTRNPSGQIVSVTLGGGGSSSIVEVATASALPATGVSGGTLYVVADVGRVYRFDASGVYVEAGTSGGGGSGGDGTDTVLRALFVPAAPTSVTATAANAQAIVAWTAPTGVIAQAPITDYVVQFSSNSGSSWTTFSDGTSTATSATVTGLTNGTAVTFRVAAVNGVGQGAWSTASSAVTPTAGDPYWGNVTLLIHADGSFIDASSAARALTTNWAQQTTDSKFGSGASYHPNGGQAIRLLGTAQPLGSGDFTIEAWVKITRPTSNFRLFSTDTTTNIFFEGGYVGVNAVSGRYYFGPHGISQDQWVHFAVCRASGYMRAFVDGVPIGTASTAISDNFTSSNFYIGGGLNDGNYDLFGVMDEIRVTVGVARYGVTSSFTPPTAAFPNS